MKRIYLSPPDMGPAEREALLKAFDSGWVAPAGPEIDAFEKEMAEWLWENAESVHCAALSSGTAALHLALILCGVQKGDRVIVSTFNFAASANAVRYCGAEPVFVDSDRETWNMDPELLSEALKKMADEGSSAKAVICADLYGQCANYGRIVPLCREFGVPLIQDAAEAVGAAYGPAAPPFDSPPVSRSNGSAVLPSSHATADPAGLQGDFGVFSFNGNKTLTTGGGGMLISRDAELIAKARFLSMQAKEPVAHYEHREVGYNYRMSSFPAAIGRAQLKRLPELIAARKAHFDDYRERLGALDGVSWIPFGVTGQPNYWLSCMILDPKNANVTTEELRLGLEAEDIEVRPLWKPLHLQPVYGCCRTFGGAVSEDLFARGLCLPSGSKMTAEERGRVVAAVERMW